jgi:hypothetical protein
MLNTQIQNTYTGQNKHTFSRPIYDPRTADPPNNKKEQYKFWESLMTQTSGYQQHSKGTRNVLVSVLNEILKTNNTDSHIRIINNFCIIQDVILSKWNECF